MKKLLTVLAAVGAAGLAGCALSPTPLPGLLYQDVKFPSYYQGVDNAGPGPKRGEAQSESILGLIAVGDSSIEAAAQNGGITKIRSADTHATNILGLYATYTTIVTGE